MILYLIILVGSAWLVQSFLGFYQIRNFNHHYTELRRQGRVAVGKKKGLFWAGTVVLIAINKGDNILAAKKMQGVTVLSRVKPMTGLDGKNIVRLTEKDLKIFDRLTVAAIQDAVANVKIVAKGGDIPQEKSLFQKLVGKFNMKKEV